MEQELDINIDMVTRKGSRFVCRVGSTMNMLDLRRVSVHKAKSIIVMCDSEGEPEAADAAVVRTVLSLCSTMSVANSNTQIVAEIRDVDSKRVLKVIGKEGVEIVVSHDIVGRLMIMSVRQPGLAKVYEEVLGFEGDEFYLQEWPDAVGIPFGDLSERFPAAVPIGIKTSEGTIVLNPAKSRKMKKHEEVLVIAEDDDSYELVDAKDVIVAPADGLDPPRKLVEKILFCGWRRDARDILTLLNDLVAPGTEIHIMCEVPIPDRKDLLESSGLVLSELKNISLVHHYGNTSARRELDRLPIEQFTSCLVVADEMLEKDLMGSDSHCITTLLLVRDIQDIRVGTELFAGCPMLCEILDVQTQKTVMANASLTDMCEFVQTNEMVSRILAMVSEDGSVNTILDELLGGKGASFQLKPASIYLQAFEEMSFLQLGKRVQDQFELLVGYQKSPAALSENTVVNPRNKHEVRFWKDVKLIVLTGEPLHPESHDNPDHNTQLSQLDEAIKDMMFAGGRSQDPELRESKVRNLLKVLSDEGLDEEVPQGSIGSLPPPTPPLSPEGWAKVKAPVHRHRQVSAGKRKQSRASSDN